MLPLEMLPIEILPIEILIVYPNLKQLFRSIKLRSQNFSACVLGFVVFQPYNAGAQSNMPLIVSRAKNIFEQIYSLNLLIMIALMGCALGGLIFGYVVRRRAHALLPKLKAKIHANYEEQLHNYQRLLDETDQCVVVWKSPNDAPVILGRIHKLQEQNIEGKDFLRFGRWLSEPSLRLLDQALNDLRCHATEFEFYVESQTGLLFQVSGIIAGTAAMARFQDVSVREAKNARLQQDMIKNNHEMSLIRHLSDALSALIWSRDRAGHINFANKAYREATGYIDEQSVDVSLFNEATRNKIKESGDYFHDHVYGIIDGERHVFDLIHIENKYGTAAVATDKSDYEVLKTEMQQMIKGHAETLDQFSTAVAVFGSDQKLKYANQAFAVLWPLDNAFLESEPSHTLVLDKLRENGIIAEKPDWRSWREELFSAYRSGEPSQQIWNLPDGRTLRVVASPHPQGGVTWLFENLTEKIDLERRYNTLIQMQGETLDHLSEGVAVFGSNGRVQLSNPALAKLWSLPLDLLVEGTHISQLQTYCAALTINNEWEHFAETITGFSERRDAISGRMDLKNHTVLDYALVPLPNGQTMMTFVNVTDTVNITRALQEKNEALQSADQLRNDFVQHVSYELRTPLTNIIGFSDMLATETFGALNQRQHEYLDHIGSESGALLNIVNDILDLATLDAGIMELDIKDVLIQDVMNYASQRIQERLGARHVEIIQTIDPTLNIIQADAARLRQILVNILSNAANFSPEESIITFKALKHGNTIVFQVHDDGFGIPANILDTVFKRFSSHSHHGARAGAGLGLSIVKSFVELHGGSVEIQTNTGQGTTVICSFPHIFVDQNASTILEHETPLAQRNFLTDKHH